jgi:hypothetical protein
MIGRGADLLQTKKCKLLYCIDSIRRPHNCIPPLQLHYFASYSVALLCPPAVLETLSAIDCGADDKKATSQFSPTSEIFLLRPLFGRPLFPATIVCREIVSNCLRGNIFTRKLSTASKICSHQKGDLTIL